MQRHVPMIVLLALAVLPGGPGRGCRAWLDRPGLWCLGQAQRRSPCGGFGHSC